RWKRAASLGDQVPVWIGLRVPQFRRDTIFEPLRDEMFQPFCLIVNLVPRVVEEIMEKTLQQPVMAKNLQSAHLPRRCQTCAVVLFVFDERRLLSRELLQHSSHGGSTDTEMMSQGVAGHPFLFRAAQLQYRFQIVVYR